MFLRWPYGNISEEPRPHQMLVHIFGAKSSPSVAGFALRRTVDNKDDFPCDMVEIVNKDFYVDDFLKSFPNVECAITTSKQLQQLLRRGGFHLSKWISNSREVISAFPEYECSPTMRDLDLSFETLTEKILGRRRVRVNDYRKQYSQNRKGILQSIASIYDPLGFFGSIGTSW